MLSWVRHPVGMSWFYKNRKNLSVCTISSSTGGESLQKFVAPSPEQVIAALQFFVESTEIGLLYANAC